MAKLREGGGDIPTFPLPASLKCFQQKNSLHKALMSIFAFDFTKDRVKNKLSKTLPHPSLPPPALPHFTSNWAPQFLL